MLIAKTKQMYVISFNINMNLYNEHQKNSFFLM